MTVLRRYATGMASLLFVALGAVTVPAAPASAATSGWSQDTSAVQSNYLQSTPDGGVVVANCSEAPTAIKVFSVAGKTTATVLQRTDGTYVKSCHAQGAVGKDGTVFGVADNNSTKFAVVAYKGTVKLWERTLPQYCAFDRLTYERAINRVLVGSDGFVYVVSLTFACYTGDYLTKLNPNTGQIVFERQLIRSAVRFLGTTSRGLVLQDNSRVIRYIKYDNTEFAPPVTAAGWVQSVDAKGRVFTTDALNDACSTLKMYTPGTAAPFSFTMPQCWQIHRVTATGKNGLAMLAFNQAGKPTLTSYTPKTGGGFNAASVVLSDTEGYRSFKSLLWPDSYLGGFLQADTNGNMLLVRPYEWKRGEQTLNGWQFTLYAANLNVVAEYDTSAFDFQQTTRFARGMIWAMAKDRLYVSVGYCTSIDPYQCGTQTTTLYAARMARLNMDYPRGTMLGVAATTATCKPVTFVGVRGSNESPFAYEGLGESVQHVKDRLVAAGLTNMEVVAVAYPATPVNFMSTNYPPDYAHSVADGIDAVSATLIQINRDCPQTQIVLVGYSQGAHATDGVRFLPTAIQSQIKAMVLFGDPLFNPALTSVNKGTFKSNLSGIWVSPIGPRALPPRQFSAAMSGRIASYCIADDPVCNLDYIDAGYCQFNPTKCPHVLYKPIWTQQAATWAREKVIS